MRASGNRAFARAWIAAATAGLALVSAQPASAAKPSADSRYSLVHGCFALEAPAGGLIAKGGEGYATGAGAGSAEGFRMQATDLGTYLLYGRDRDFLAVDGDAVVAAAEPSRAAEWRVEEAGHGAFTLVSLEDGRALGVGGDGRLVPVDPGAAVSFAFTRARGCAVYPEVEVNVKGAPTRGSPLYGEVSGLLEGHMHGMAFEFLGGAVHCGRPWHRYGAPYALVDCPDHAAGDGCGAALDNALYGNPARCHDPGGWPTFTGWPDYKSLTHEQSYWRWLERAWRGGLRVYVNLMVENRALCELYPLKRNSCNEMDSVLLQIKRIRELQDYIDAQAGGPGKGFFRIVTNPFQARKVINRGKLAVVQGMEVSEPFGCRLQFGAPQCDRDDIVQWLDRLDQLGLRQFELINKFDNALTGVKGDSGTVGPVVNFGNFYTTGRFWDLEHCDDAENADNTPTGVHVHNDDALIANGFNAFLPPGAAPVYPEPPHCNTLGLSELGDFAIRELVRHEMIFDPDHMSAKARNQALNVVESEDYSGVFSSHSWSTPNAMPRIYRLGGVVTPSSSEADGFVHTWRDLRKAYSGRQYFGIGYGADQNGFATQPGPRDPNTGPPVSYPFRSFDGRQKVLPQQSGERTYDINSDGIAHYGLYPDWVEDLRMVGGKRIVRDMGRGAEAYLQMWERAEGIGAVRCDLWRRRFLTAAGFKRRLELGDRPRRVLERSGQPVSRTRVWRWCANSRGGGSNAKAREREVVAIFTKRGRVGTILSTLRDHRAAGVAPGEARRELPRGARAVGGGVFVSDAGGGRLSVYGTRGNRVRLVGVTSAAVAANAARLRRQLERSGLH